jgi:hypothetical protein
MKKTLIAIAAAAAIATGFSAVAQARPLVGNCKHCVRHPHHHFGFRHNNLRKYDYQPRNVCKRHYRWTLTRFGWRNVYVGYWCEHTNND